MRWKSRELSTDTSIRTGPRHSLAVEKRQQYLVTFNVAVLSDVTNRASQADLVREAVAQPSLFRSYASKTSRDEANPIDGRFIMPEYKIAR